MATLVELHEGDVLVIRRANPNPPFEGELESLAQLASDCGLAGVLVLGVDDTLALTDDDRLREVGLQRVEKA